VEGICALLAVHAAPSSGRHHISRQCSMCITSPFTIVVTYFWVLIQKKFKKFKNIVGRKPFGLFFLKIEFSLSIGPSSMKNMLSNFNLCIFKLSQPIFVFKNIVGRKPHFKTVFNVYYFPLHGCCYLFLSPPQKKYKKFKNIVGRKPFGLFFLKIKFSLSIAQKMTKDWLRKFKNTKIEI
jgi:hypothetical protein